MVSICIHIVAVREYRTIQGKSLINKDDVWLSSPAICQCDDTKIGTYDWGLVKNYIPRRQG